MTCHLCYWFKLRWRDGSGTCWQTGQDTPRHADAATCEHYTPKVIVITKAVSA